MAESPMPEPKGELKSLPALGHALLRRLGLHECGDVLRHARFERYRAMEKIFRKGDPPYGLLAVLKGRVKLSSRSADGKEILFDILESGRIFGEVALLDGKPRAHDATALEDSLLLVLRRQDLLPVLYAQPQLCVHIMTELCGRLRRTDELVEDMHFLGLSSRFGKRLLRLAERFGRPDRHGRVRIDLALTQQELAGLVGMTRESINKQIGRWRKSGILDFKRGIVTIHDGRRLREIAEPAPPAAPAPRLRPPGPPRGSGRPVSARSTPVLPESRRHPAPAPPPPRSRSPHA
ncbi:MAG: Crp/Fnr family transcriptional regulator [Alphaproteobacteria bacterium]|nr:Crp/Fnr family transcriptional regulator [Alphaproteobacteria bacterium]